MIIISIMVPYKKSIQYWPISTAKNLKDSIKIQGQITTLGYSAWAEKLMTKQVQTVQKLIK